MKKILVANRGEIAVRIMKTAKKMGICTVAVYSEADAEALHVKTADEAYYIGPSPSSESYLKMEKILQVAKDSGCDGIHPGYGFLSENAKFSQAVKDAGITFIGPKSESIEIMGSKLRAKEAVKAYDIPLVPGTDHAVTDIAMAKRTAQDIGFPLLIKASAGGGGKGMRLVSRIEDFEEQMGLAQDEALSAFGDGAVFIEKFVEKPRHIEIQILMDRHGNGLHLFERECSIQRRHQKVIEEAPSAILTEETRSEMGQHAINVAKSCNYEGAGTVEFLLDAHGNYYFLEMNTRLQVEHPVTEMISGVDLVEQQIKIARGEELALKQEELEIHGHAFELRIYAEDPFENFNPSIGTLEKFRFIEDEYTRLDTGYLEGMEVPIFYDPMLAKLVVWGETRALAAEKMRRAINSFEIEGIESTCKFGSFVFENEAFLNGDFDTNFVKKYWSEENYHEKQKDKRAVAAKASVLFYRNILNSNRARAFKTSRAWYDNR